MRNHRTAGLVLVLGLGCAVPATAQIARVRTASADAPKILVVPFQREPNDSAVAVAIPDGIRNRIRAAHLTRWNPILKDGMNRALTESGFQTEVPLDQSVARQLARFLNARLIIEGNILPRGQDSVLIIARLVEASGATPQSATASMTVLRSRAPTVGAELANNLAASYASFEDVQQCRQHLDAQRIPQAKAEAASALRRYPNSSSALLCLANALRAENAPVDSVEAVLTRATDVDTLNTTVRRQLAAIYEQRGDTARLLHQLQDILQIDRSDKDLRMRAARLYVQIGTQTNDSARARLYADSAVQLLNYGLERNQADVDLLTTKSIALAVARRWDSAAVALELVASADSQKVDSLFLFRMTNYLKAVPDSARLLTWTRIATQKFPQHLPYWFDLNQLAMARGDTATALEAGRQYIQAAPATDGRGHLLIGVVFAARQQTDSSLYHAQQAVVKDSTLKPQTYGFFQQAGMLALRDSNYSRAESLLTQARDFAPQQGKGRPAYYLGLSQLQLVIKDDAAANENRDCQAVQRVRDRLPMIEQNIITGVAENRQVANQILSQYVPAFRQRSDAFWRNFRCDRATGNGRGGL